MIFSHPAGWRCPLPSLCRGGRGSRWVWLVRRGTRFPSRGAWPARAVSCETSLRTRHVRAGRSTRRKGTSDRRPVGSWTGRVTSDHLFRTSRVPKGSSSARKCRSSTGRGTRDLPAGCSSTRKCRSSTGKGTTDHLSRTGLVPKGCSSTRKWRSSTGRGTTNHHFGTSLGSRGTSLVRELPSSTRRHCSDEGIGTSDGRKGRRLLLFRDERPPEMDEASPIRDEPPPEMDERAPETHERRA